MLLECHEGEISTALANGRFVTIRDALPTELAEALHAELSAAQTDPLLAFRRRSEEQKYKGQAAQNTESNRTQFTEAKLLELYAAVQSEGRKRTPARRFREPTKSETLKCCGYGSTPSLLYEPMIYYPSVDGKDEAATASVLMCQGSLDAYDQKFQFETHGTSYHPIAADPAAGYPHDSLPMADWLDRVRAKCCRFENA